MPVKMSIHCPPTLLALSVKMAAAAEMTNSKCQNYYSLSSAQLVLKELAYKFVPMRLPVGQMRVQ